MNENDNQQSSLEQSLVNPENLNESPPEALAPLPAQPVTPPPIQPPEEDIEIGFLSDPRETLSVRKAFRLTPSADATIRKLTHFAYVAGKKGKLSPGQMPDETLTAYVNFAFDCAKSFLEQL